MPASKPKITEELRRTREELARLKAEKSRLFPPNPHPFAQADRYPRDFLPRQIQRRHELIAQIEELEQRIEELEDQPIQP